MFHQLAAYVTVYAFAIRDRVSRSGRDGGYSTESVAVTAALVALALAAIALLGPKVKAKIEGITL
ncbi:hypothetical protein Aca07nite_73490 [Actinoplanes capillaceus]|uniref:Uncharacterized protein n=1 Tax=Actinoplanes campanulatus TaxID=113559 RepID=A0ABQ3WUX5_9ACTN|nr:hypothetical protein [Actinoplanes capillaceus]GID50074.1 hypothetical protein Aca07nite_73490 [Actinoplanes capillaceus]